MRRYIYRSFPVEHGSFGAMKRETGWTYVEFIIALMVFSLLVVTVYPLLTVFKASDLEKQMHLQAIWLGQEVVERQMAVATDDRQAAGSEVVQVDNREYDVRWTRQYVSDGLDSVEVNVQWQIGEKQRGLRLERYILLR